MSVLNESKNKLEKEIELLKKENNFVNYKQKNRRITKQEIILFSPYFITLKC